MSEQKTFEDLPSTTFLQVSEAGAAPCDLQGGQMIGPSGPEAAHVSHSRQQESSKESPTSGTSGPCSSTSSASADLTQSLVNRLKLRFDTDGSTLFKLTWKEQATPLGRSVCLLRASALRTSDKGCGSSQDKTKDGSEPTDSLIAAARQAPWTTPSTRDWKDSGGMKTEAEDGRTRLDQLPRQAFGATQNGSTAATVKPGQLNPALARWLMGYPVEWCQAAIRTTRAMPTPRRKRG